jgi:ADP-heptose:LPS heptosyltransferase
VHPTASDQERVWHPERFAQAAAHLQRRYGGTVVIVTHQRAHPAAECVAASVSGPCLNLAGMTSLPVLGAVIERLNVLVTNDTGPAHIGYALRVPTVTVFAAHARPPFWPPEVGPFQPLLCAGHGGASSEETRASLDSITVDQVLAAVDMLMR